MHAWCPSDKKCCRQKDSYTGYMCCPFEDGVCCGENSYFCCKSHETCGDYHCRDKAIKTSGGALSHPFLMKVMNNVPNKQEKKDESLSIAEPLQKKLNLVKKLSADYPIVDGALCTGNKACPIYDNNNKTVGYTCCPYLKNATCCESWCCDEGFKCGDPFEQTCILEEEKTNVKKPIEAITLFKCPPSLNDTCAEDQTCCITPDKHFNCAPFANATCCKDGVHSCPQGYKCDEDTNVCSPEKNMTANRLDRKHDGTIECDAKMLCADTQTCCRLTDGSFGCCPFKNATCCSDHIHCCRENFVCDDESHMCINPSDLKSESPLQLVAKIVADVQCNDGSKCPTGMTCCPIGNDKFGCCPFEDATCCSDMAHCCPKETVCNTERGTCDSPSSEAVVSNLNRIQIMESSLNSSNIICDESMECRSNQTCCRLTDGSFGCCPFKDAVCCSDHVHCCSHGMWCNHKTKTCKDPTDSVPMARKLPAIQRETVSQPSSLPLGLRTLAKKSGSLPIGVKFPATKEVKNVKDTVPQALGTPAKKSDSIPIGVKFPATKENNVVQDTVSLSKKIPANKAPSVSLAKTSLIQSKWIPRGFINKTFSKESPDAVECKDGYTYCPKSTDCCKLINGQYGCCPPKTNCCDSGEGCYGCCPDPYNVCCNNGEWCCGNGTVCDLGRKSCRPKDSTLCADGSYCDKGTSCCQLHDKNYTCCYENTKCCEGGKGCCPNGWGVCCEGGEWCCQDGVLCDVPKKGCKYAGPESEMIGLAAPVFKRNESVSVVTNTITELANVKCDDGSSCPSGTTCCKLSSGEWGCCPYPEAVCCDDGEHCCPSGYTCDVSAGTCDRADTQSELTVLTVGSVPCGDGTSCPSGTTCCKLSSGEWGCCPYPEAVCCDDGEHCCPSGYTCDVSAGTCNRADTQSELTVLTVGSVPCGDGTSCPSGTTCCKLSSGEWGCCPYPEAVCCDDGEHCCPSGYTCDVSAGTCDRADTQSELTVLTVGSVPCGDGSSCPSGTTCCKLSSGEWGCCPYPEAVCCDDGEHCCPSGYTCDVSAGTCDRADTQFELTVLTVGSVPCGDGTSCPSGTTCCKLSSGEWGCCPYPEAVCCDDGEHCCPSGYTCDVSAGTCDRADTQSELTVLTVGSVPCGDGTSCPSGTTCCKLSSGEWGCCPYPEAVCCDDGEHCCPSGYTCDVSAGTCDRADTQSELTVLTVGSVPCGDGTSCPSGTTCCKLSSGEWGCCPYPEAVCCDDGEHCCPSGYTCDVSAGTCNRADTQSELTVLTVGSVPCGDGTSCPSGTTCCKLSSGEWGCCPYPEAVCCDDGEHCCPSGYTCDVSAGTCNRADTQSELTVLTVGSVPCGDGTSCPSGTTCCKLSSGEWGCCPYPEAVCCDDGEHCCPSGYTCDVSAGTCNRADTQSELTVLTVGSVPCGDGTSCPSGTTCCKLSSGEWGCCPYPEAVCCDDGEHCCPSGYTCDVSAGTCDRADTQSELTVLTVGSVPCGDGTSCPSGTTCCKLSSGEWGCCPYPEAVCCDDGEHCCPSGYTCDVSAGTCDRADTQSELTVLTVGSVPCGDGTSCPSGTTCCKLSSGEWGCCPYPEAVCCDDGEHCCPSGYTCDVSAGTCDRADTQSELTVLTVGSVPCGDGTSCPSGTTCCKLSSGEWGCCPYPEAVCCDDGEHCCPSGYTCDVSAGTCDRADTQSELTVLTVGSVLCGDGTSCPSGTTCCKLSSGEWGCCPYPEAVCCDDGEHCCPSGYTCDVSAGTCNRADTQSELTVLTVGSVPCGDGTSCPSGTTCCKLSSGEWGCCPYPEAVCCDDGEHCCPSGYTCDVSAGTCDRADTQSELTVLTVGSVPCGDGTSCPSGTTCCKLSSGEWGCCPYPEAVCCDDGEHCCPSGYTCDISAGTCTHSQDSTGNLPTSQRVGKVVPAQGTSLESDVIEGETGAFCKNGKWCKSGVCCNNTNYCCNETEICTVEGDCIPTNVTNPITEGYNSECSTCGEEDTCCNGQCCPQADAVCCPGGESCCPADFECDTLKDRCVQRSTGRFQPMIKHKNRSELPHCDNLKACGNGSFCPHHLECLNLFRICYSLQNEGHQTMIDKCE
ncbi:hypothetical protein ACHWQZ_G018711 [Mnemiopsis leidyi]